ncbi:unnamed protein product [Lactuca virosa]|uniref:Uncharacterized protein n=1 Tax=Lactuca virosa TaxID=75947 RepID=A0AAU9NMC5_9ASTR|nr:unnamed protein product [Lactuca virosa]
MTMNLATYSHKSKTVRHYFDIQRSSLTNIRYFPISRSDPKSQPRWLAAASGCRQIRRSRSTPFIHLTNGENDHNMSSYGEELSKFH